MDDVLATIVAHNFLNLKLFGEDSRRSDIFNCQAYQECPEPHGCFALPWKCARAHTVNSGLYSGFSVFAN
jgi:hypothetical protein